MFEQLARALRSTPALIHRPILQHCPRAPARRDEYARRPAPVWRSALRTGSHTWLRWLRSNRTSGPACSSMRTPSVDFLDLRELLAEAGRKSALYALA